jgi:putative nucleotidyltransferase with HDIG domain
MTHYIDNYSYPYKQKSLGSVSRTIEKLTDLSRLSHFLAGSETVEDLVDRASGYILELLHINYCRIYILMDDGHYNLLLNGHESNKVVEKAFYRLSNSQEIQRPSSIEQHLDQNCLKSLDLSEPHCHWVIPLKVERSPVGILLLAAIDSKNKDAFPKDTFYLVDLIADQLGNALHRKQLNERLVNSSLETVLALSKTLETRDPYSGEHSKQLAVLSEQMALHFNLSTRETRELCWAALLHDIGKIGVEDQILHKPGPLTAREWEIMKSHSEVGAQIVKGLSGLENIASIILAHHERMDGTGYPHKLMGEQIPFGARIIAVVDSYSAMTEGRVYRPPRTHEEAISELRKFSGKMFDPDVVDAFICVIENQNIKV